MGGGPPLTREQFVYQVNKIISKKGGADLLDLPLIMDGRLQVHEGSGFPAHRLNVCNNSLI